MPKPHTSTYPKEQRWRFVQRNITQTELLAFSKNILKYHGRKIDDICTDLLSFVNTGQVGPKEAWLDIWVNILHQMGLGYTWGKGKYLYSTELCNFLCETKDVKAYYTYWALKFQFPFGFPKQKHYIKNNVAVQPVVLILQHLVQLHALTRDIKKSYITKDEITKFLMRAKDHNYVLENSKLILSLRESGYDYSLEEKLSPGFNEAGNQFFSRGRLFIENVELVKFSHDKIIIENEKHLQRIIDFLTFVKPPIVFTENSQDMRNKFFSIVYNHLSPYPTVLVAGKYPVKKTARPHELTRAELVREITNPTDINGLFANSVTRNRLFQSKLRRDLLSLYNQKCCICGLNNNIFLRTAHIVPVEIDPGIAADRRNCILLCVLHDVAFEQGFIFIDDKYKVRINEKYLEKMQHPLLKEELLKRENQKIVLPNKLKPKQEYLRRHIKLLDFRRGETNAEKRI